MFTIFKISLFMAAQMDTQTFCNFLSKFSTGIQAKKFDGTGRLEGDC